MTERMNTPDLTRHFAEAVDTWLQHHDAAVADLIARHEAHKARIAESQARFDAFLNRDGER